MRVHGKVSRYAAGCRCDACVTAKSEYRKANRLRGNGRPKWPSTHTSPTGELAVECWCRAAVVWVAPEAVRACLTESCGRDVCAAPERRQEAS